MEKQITLTGRAIAFLFGFVLALLSPNLSPVTAPVTAGDLQLVLGILLMFKGFIG